MAGVGESEHLRRSRHVTMTTDASRAEGEEAARREAELRHPLVQ